MAKKGKKEVRNGGENTPSRVHWGIAGAVFALILGVILIGGAVVYPYWYQGRTYPGVKVGNLRVGNLTRAELSQTLQRSLDEYSNKGIVLTGFGSSRVMYPTVSALGDLDLSYDLVNFDADATIQDAMMAGRNLRSSFFANSLNALGYRLIPLKIPLRVTLQRERVVEFIRQEFSAHERAARDASFMVAANGSLTVAPEQVGEMINMEEALEALYEAVRQGSHGPVYLESIVAYPRVREDEVMALLDDAQMVMMRAPYEVRVDPGSLPASYHRQEMEKKAGEDVSMWRKDLASATLASWFTVVRQGGGVPRLGFFLTPLSGFLASFHDTFDIPAQDAKFSVHDGKVTEFQSSQDGIRVDDEASRINFENEFLMRGNTSAVLAFGIERASVQTDAVNNLGIRERLGVGTSNFSGSPKNRRHNIDVGVVAVNGTLIAPGEEFSLLKTLGEIDGAHGYLPELVIKGSRTIPEYGGGLCQIGTTAFRTALAAGMPITARRNHSYRVRYYEPAGTDATIYSPSPDFRFLNDTGSYLLFQARTEEDDAVFELWGTSDGRIATSTKPSIFNTVAPPPTKYVKTAELKPGEKKCTERPHNGADASFTYRVAYASGETKEQEFKSHYRPWQEVCLVGASAEEILEESSKPPDGTSAGDDQKIIPSL